MISRTSWYCSQTSRTLWKVGFGSNSNRWWRSQQFMPAISRSRNCISKWSPKLHRDAWVCSCRMKLRMFCSGERTILWNLSRWDTSKLIGWMWRRTISLILSYERDISLDGNTRFFYQRIGIFTNDEHKSGSLLFLFESSTSNAPHLEAFKIILNLWDGGIKAEGFEIAGLHDANFFELFHELRKASKIPESPWWFQEGFLFRPPILIWH